MTPVVQVWPYDADWPLHFQTLKERIWPVVAEHALSIEHVGSTSVPGLAAKDIIDLDVVVLGPRLKAGQTIEREIVGVVRFWDAGLPDDKLIASESPLSPKQRTGLRRFFKIYALARLALNKRKGLSGRTAFVSVVNREELDQPWRNTR